MKLASLLLLALLGGVAHADDDRTPVDPYDSPRVDPFGPSTRGHADPFGPPNARGPVDPFAAPRPRMAKRNQLRQLLLQRFDRNRDGQLQPQERRQAAKALRKLAQRVERGNAKQGRKQRFIRRYDINRDGNIGPGEMPPAIADELRPLDQDGDGWLHGHELP